MAEVELLYESVPCPICKDGYLGLLSKEDRMLIDSKQSEFECSVCKSQFKLKG